MRNHGDRETVKALIIVARGGCKRLRGRDAAMIIEVAIGPSPAAGKFRVEVVSSPAGEAAEVVELDV